MRTQILALLLGTSYVFGQNSGENFLRNTNHTHPDTSTPTSATSTTATIPSTHVNPNSNSHTNHTEDHSAEMRPHHHSDTNDRNHHHNRNNNNDISTPKCVIKGEYFQKCVNEKEKVIWNEDYKKINHCFKYSRCQQVNKKCQWIQTSEMKNCLDKIVKNKKKPIIE